VTCGSAPPTFRLLDARVGWDPYAVSGLVGLDDTAGIRLAPAGGGPDGPSTHDLLLWFPDPRLAPGCGPCNWYLLAPQRGVLRRRDCRPPGAPAVDDVTACDCPEWIPIWPADSGLPTRPTAVAARGHLLAVVDDDRVLIWRGEGERLIAVIPGPATAVAFTCWGEILLARPGRTELERRDLAGDLCGCLATCVAGNIERVATGSDWSIFVLSRDQGRLLLWRGDRDGGAFAPATLADLAASGVRTALTETSDLGFCLSERGADGTQARNCFSWEGERLRGTEVGAPAPPAREPFGELVTGALDSGLPRCRWHRVRVDADIPTGTSVEIAIATSEQASDGPGADAGLPAGAPHLAEWQEAPLGSPDYLINQPPGRYLFLRLRLRGSGAASPTVRRVRLDFPRVTSAELLPPVYRQDPAADDFTERFLGLFDASLASLDRVVERYPALLDYQGVPDELLPWLGNFLGLVFDPTWDAATRRALLAAAPELYRRRGTPWALASVLRIVFKVEPVIEELARERNWATLGGDSRLSTTRLFGRAAARFRLDGSALGGAPLRSYGNPDDDPLTAQAHRFRVFLPPTAAKAGPDRAAVTRFVEDQAPAHLVAQIRIGGTGFILGSSSRVGVDTAFRSLPAPVLGTAPAGQGRPVRLNRDSVLWPGGRGHWCGVRVGLRSAVAVNTVVE
jgi:phage tail-like protein